MFEEDTGFDDAFMYWLSKIDWRKFGSFLKIDVTKNHKNERLQKVDLSAAKLVGSTINNNFYEQGKKYAFLFYV